MPDLLHGNSPDAWLIGASIAAGALGLLWVARTIVRRKLADARNTPSEVDDLILDLAERTRIFLLIIPVLFLGIRLASIALPIDQARLLRIGARLSLITQCALWVSAVANFWLRRYRRTRVEPESQTIAHIFGVAIAATVWSVAILVALQNLGFNITAIVAGLGIGGVAVALALQNILGDLFASLSIIIDKPFVVGDPIMVDGQSGTIEHIGMKTTRIRAAGGQELIIGNGDLLKSRIHNFRRMARRRALLRIGVAWETPVETLERIPSLIRAAVEKHEHARFDRAHFVAFTGGSHEFEAVYYVESADYGRLLDIQQAVDLDLVRTFAAEEIALTAAAQPAVVARP